MHVLDDSFSERGLSSILHGDSYGYELRFQAEAAAKVPRKLQEAYDQSFENRQRLESEFYISAIRRLCGQMKRGFVRCFPPYVKTVGDNRLDIDQKSKDTETPVEVRLAPRRYSGGSVAVKTL